MPLILVGKIDLQGFGVGATCIIGGLIELTYFLAHRSEPAFQRHKRRFLVLGIVAIVFGFAMILDLMFWP